MKRLLPLLFALLLSGCYWNQKQQLVACALKSAQYRSREDVPAGFPPGAAYAEACMRAHGYELNQDQCPALRDDVIRLDPASIAALGEKPRKAYTEDIERRLAVLAAWRKAEPLPVTSRQAGSVSKCYGSKNGLGLEIRTHRARASAAVVLPGLLKKSITRCIAGCCRFLTFTQCGERPAR